MALPWFRCGVKAIRVKGFIAFVVLLFLLAGAGIGFYGWGRLSKIEPRGVGLVVENEIPDAEAESISARYNEILDREEVLMRTVKEHNLKGYYKVSSDQKALTLFREDSYIALPGGNNLHVLFNGKRITRKERDAASRTLAEDFVKAARLATGQ